MGMLRILSGSIEILAAMLMFRLNDVEKAMIVNSSLALVGPIILLSTTAVGLVGMSGKLSLFKMVFIISGVMLILIGVRSK